MATKKKLLEAAAGAAAGGAGLDVEDVFSTYLYEGNGSTQTITNGIDLSGEGGAVWIKSRTSTAYNLLHDTERGATKTLYTNTTNAEITNANGLSAFTSSGFTVGTEGAWNGSGNDFASWTFRKAPGFFDCLTYTGDGASSRSISHNLGTVPGLIIIKQTSGSAENWIVWHRSISNQVGGQIVYLNATDSQSSMNGKFDDTNLPTSTTFTVEQDNSVNASGSTYVAYLFAHHDGDGEFGPDSDQDIIKCGSYSGTTSVDLGFEPQFLLRKRVDSSGNWAIQDTMRGWGPFTPGSYEFDYLLPNTSGAEGTSYGGIPTSTGFTNSAPGDYIYLAIRRGPIAVPTDATDVFTPVLGTSSGDFTAEAGFPVDLNWYARRSVADGGFTWDRLRGPNYLLTYSGNIEVAYSAASFDSNTAFYLDGVSGDYSDFMTYNWRRAPSFMDVVYYTGDGVNNRQLNHNLGVAPEMIWVKKRYETPGSGSSASWHVYLGPLSSSGDVKYNILNATNGALDDTTSNFSSIFYDAVPTADDFTLGNSSAVNRNGYDFVAYLFASASGVSKIGTVTLDASGDTNVDCGFSSGARFVLMKSTSIAGGWLVWDTVRGISVGTDPYFLLNSNAAEDNSADFLEPYSQGFTIKETNFLSGTYLFYAIA